MLPSDTLNSYEENITLSADEDLIEQARPVARSQRKALNAAFREWLLTFAAQSGNGQGVDALMRRIRHVKAGRHFSRDEMNERWIFSGLRPNAAPAYPSPSSPVQPSAEGGATRDIGNLLPPSRLPGIELS